MMSPENLSATKEETHQSSGATGGRKESSAQRPTADQQQPVKCPRCDSPNTKFCYYNNYSLTQPRHFCKTCRRYWTKGGALRNVPIGGGCRKNKRIKPSTSASSRLLADDPHSKELDFGGLNFFHGLSPAMDFQLGSLSLPRTAFFNQFSPFSDISSSAINGGVDLGSSSSASFLGFNYPAAAPKQGGESISGLGGSIQEMGSMNGNGTLASSIESLSSINQELHLKLQQQRLAMLYGADGENNNSSNTNQRENAVCSVSGTEKPQPILFQNLEMSNSSRKDGSTVWFFDSSFATTPTNSGSNNNESAAATMNLNGVQAQAWTRDLHQFNGLS
ncbi:hypothetical protein Nepgr_025977 [Nepenthes gracilis]|uniref:Dof zinc finger protein n=1 Tax=Nepenthes gracilis TaxID=150966 RepID=A0AAD3Y1L6_NEPGR|nr:hypothetical protein Nepgr_025977 [Nepenthes gracilis]